MKKIKEEAGKKIRQNKYKKKGKAGKIDRKERQEKTLMSETG